MNSCYVFEYLYRDANNFKAFGELLLCGAVLEQHICELKSYLYDGEYFVAEQVNIPTLYSQLWAYSNGPTLADHTFHEFLTLRPATNNDLLSIKLWGETARMLEGFKVASKRSWDCSLSVHCSAF